MDPTDIPESFRLRLDEPRARHWLAHAIAHTEGYEPLGASQDRWDWMLSDEQAGKLNDLEAAVRLEGGRIGPDRADELDHLRALRAIDELRDEKPPEGRLAALNPGIDLGYNPARADDANPTDELVSYACEGGLFGDGAHVDFGFSYNAGGDSGFWWHIALVVGNSTLNLASEYFELDVLAAEHERGLEAAISVLREAERAANDVIGKLPVFLAAVAARKSCSCGEAWADQPGHDDGANSRD